MGMDGSFAERCSGIVALPEDAEVVENMN